MKQAMRSALCEFYRNFMLNGFFPIRMSARMFFVTLGLGLCGLILFGWTVAHTMGGSQRAGFFGKVAVQLSLIPDGIRDIATARHFAEVNGNYVRQKAGFERMMPNAEGATDSGILLPRYSPDAGHFVVDLVSEETGKVWHRFDPHSPLLGFEFPAFGFEAGMAGSRARYRPIHPYLTEDGGLLFASNSPLIRVDACANVLWSIPGVFHHSIEMDAHGNFWAPRLLQTPSRRADAMAMEESELVQISPSGKVLTRIPLYDIFARNDMQVFVDGRPTHEDPYHINDIQPVLTSGPFWQKDDLFVSLRHLSMVLLYRPSTGRVIWHREGPWLAQHDVNIVDDNRISIFDNHVSLGFSPSQVDGTNRMAILDFRTNAVSYDYDAAFKRHAIKTVSGGRATILPGGDVLVDENNGGRLMRVAPDGALRWQYIHAKPDLTRINSTWSRYLDSATFGGAMKNAREAKCPVAN